MVKNTQTKYNPPSVEEDTHKHVESFHIRHLSSDEDGDPYDHSSFKGELFQLIRTAQEYRTTSGVKLTPKQHKAWDIHSRKLEIFVCAGDFAIKYRTFSTQLSNKYDVYNSAFHNFMYDGGKTAMKDGYLPSGQKPTESKEMFGLTMINAFTESEIDMWIDGLILGFEYFYNGYSKMKLIMFNWKYHQLPHFDELMLDLTDKYVHKVMDSSDDVFKQVLVGQIAEDIKGTGKIVYYTNWRFLRMFVSAIHDMIETDKTL